MDHTEGQNSLILISSKVSLSIFCVKYGLMYVCTLFHLVKIIKAVSLELKGKRDAYIFVIYENEYIFLK